MSNEKIQEIEIMVGKMQSFLQVMFEKLQDSINNIVERVNVLEQHDEEFQKQVHQSCDLMNQTVDSKIEKAVKKLEEDFDRRINTLATVHEKKFTAVYWALGALWTLFVSYVAYDNYQLGSVHEKINSVNENVVMNSTKLDSLVISISDIKDDLRKSDQHKHYKESKRIDDE